MTSSVPVSGEQVMAKLTSTVPSAGTVTGRGFSPPTAQPAATPESVTVVGPAATAGTLTVALAPIGCAAPSPMANAYPSGSAPGPLVTVTTLTVPAAQTTAISSAAVSPATTVSVRGLSPCTVQLGETPASPIRWAPGLSSASVAVAAIPIGWTSTASRVNA